SARAANAAPRERPAPAVACPSLVVATRLVLLIFDLARPEHRRIIAYHVVRGAGQTACERAVVMLELVDRLERCAPRTGNTPCLHSPASTDARHLRAHALLRPFAPSVHHGGLS